MNSQKSESWSFLKELEARTEMTILNEEVVKTRKLNQP